MQRLIKNTIIAFLLAAVLFQTFATVGVIVQFQINRSYYAEVLCINKNRPELACHGKCVLMQRLKHEFEQSQDAERRTLQNLFDRELTLFCADYSPFIIKNRSFYRLNKKEKPTSSFKFFPQSVFDDIFHPPA
jgi:hypothetical protein